MSAGKRGLRLPYILLLIDQLPPFPGVHLPVFRWGGFRYFRPMIRLWVRALSGDGGRGRIDHPRVFSDIYGLYIEAEFYRNAVGVERIDGMNKAVVYGLRNPESGSR